jgi:hypothetical protein
MVNVDIDPSIYKHLKRIVEQNRIEFPSIKFFVQKVLLERLEAERGGQHRGK